MLPMILRYMLMLFMSIVVWTGFLPFLASVTVFWGYGYLLGGMSGANSLLAVIFLGLLTATGCFSITLIMSFAFWCVVILLRKRLLFTPSASQNLLAISFAFMFYVLLFCSNKMWTWLACLYGVSFIGWGFVLLKGLLKVFSRLMRLKST